MVYYLKFLIVAHVLCVCASVSKNSEIKIFTKQWRIDAASKFMNSKFLAEKSDTYVYANCSTTNNCNVIVEDSKDKKVCTLRLLANHTRVLQTDATQLTPRLLRHQNVIVSHRERTVSDMFQVITVTNMSNCHTTYLTYKYERPPYLLLTNVVLHEKTFDVIIGGTAVCAGLEWCRITYDLEGKRVGKPLPFDTSLVLFQTEAIVHEGYYLFGLTDRPFELRAVHVDAFGVETVLAQPDVFDPSNAPRALSSVHEMLGVCWYNSSYPHDPTVVVQCKQFDVRGKKVMESRVSNLGIVKNMAVHNLEQGGILLVTSGDSDTSKVTKIRRDGSVEEVQMELPSGIVDQVSFRDEDGVCFHFTAQYYDSIKGLLSYFRKCVPKVVICNK